MYGVKRRNDTLMFLMLASELERKISIRREYKIKQSLEDLEDFIRKNTPDMRNVLESYYAAEQNAITRKRLSEMLGFKAIGTELSKIFQENTDYLKSGLSSSWLTAAKDQMKKISDIISSWLRVPFLADANRRLLNYIDTEALMLAVSLADQRYLVLTDMLSFIAANDIGLSTAITLMQQNMVLTPTMADWVKKSFVKNINAGMSRQEALKLARQKSEKLKNWRSRTQIRTELTRAKGEADIEALRQGIEKGRLQNVYKIWRRTAYNDNHQNSLDNDGITVPLEGLWADGSFKPSEINERCVMEYVMIRRNNGN